MLLLNDDTSRRQIKTPNSSSESSLFASTLNMLCSYSLVSHRQAVTKKHVYLLMRNYTQQSVNKIINSVNRHNGSNSMKQTCSPDRKYSHFTESEVSLLCEIFLTIEAVCTSEVSVCFNETTRHYIPEGCLLSSSFVAVYIKAVHRTVIRTGHIQSTFWCSVSSRPCKHCPPIHKDIPSCLFHETFCKKMYTFPISSCATLPAP
jgi:hypothetical protein